MPTRDPPLPQTGDPGRVAAVDPLGMDTGSPQGLPLSAAQSRFVAEHHAASGDTSFVSPGSVYVYRRERTGGTTRWLIDQAARVVETLTLR